MITIRKREDICVNDLLKTKNYLDRGASKEAVGDDTTVYKFPRGRDFIENTIFFNEQLKYPTSLDQFEDFLEKINEEEPAMVWPIGQCVLEIIIWEALKILNRQYGVDIKRFAPIKDYYLDKNGVIVIEQERVNGMYSEPMGRDERNNAFDDLCKELDIVNSKLKETADLEITDIRYGNCGFNKQNKCLQVFDFGLSTSCSIRSYDDYDSWVEEDCYDSYYDSYNSADVSAARDLL